MNIKEFDKDKMYLYDMCIFEDKKQKINLQKTYGLGIKRYQYFLKAYINEGAKEICQGYIYFYLNEDNKTSEFIGLYIKPEYRNSGIASLLVTEWITFCLNNNFDYLETIKQQRKPFLLYILKTYGFEILNSNEYKSNKHVIDICKKENELTKYLFFRNPSQKESFMQGKIAKEDNYQVLEEFTPEVFYLDSIILSQKFIMTNTTKAKEKTNLVLRRHH